MTKRKSFHLKQKFDGAPKEEDFEVVEEELPAIKDGEFLVEHLFNSVDPYQRAHTEMQVVGSPMGGTAVGKVTESKDSDYPVGSIVTGHFGWHTHTIASKKKYQADPFFRKHSGDVNPSHTLGILGLTGFTAYFGLLDICNPKAGETVFVNAAAGATGSTVGQIAKIKGCRVVGCAGSDEKVAYLKSIGFDEAFNYKTVNLPEKLKELCPKGIDCFFDNVGGKMFDAAAILMNRLGRISLCGAISGYNDPSKLAQGPYVHMYAIGKELKIQGFMCPTFAPRFSAAEKDISNWIKEGKIKVSEHVVEGFENMPKAFNSLFTGSNIGKLVVKV